MRIAILALLSLLLLNTTVFSKTINISDKLKVSIENDEMSSSDAEKVLEGIAAVSLKDLHDALKARDEMRAEQEMRLLVRCYQLGPKKRMPYRSAVSLSCASISGPFPPTSLKPPDTITA